jgi:hypothetical protein
VPTPAEPEGPPTPGTTAFVVASYVVVLLLTVLLALWGAFLVPLRVGGVPVPVSWVIAVGGNVGVAVMGARLLGHRGAAVPGLLWLALAATLAARRSEGDLIVAGTLVGLGFLLLGALASAVSYSMLSSRASPTRGARR